MRTASECCRQAEVYERRAEFRFADGRLYADAAYERSSRPRVYYTTEDISLDADEVRHEMP